jgi:hypothetical protein
MAGRRCTCYVNDFTQAAVSAIDHFVMASAEAAVPHAAFTRPGIPPSQTRGRLIMMAVITFALYAVGLVYLD